MVLGQHVKFCSRLGHGAKDRAQQRYGDSRGSVFIKEMSFIGH
ncbi:MAG: hypothetical protein JW384_03772 [Nitrosomonadaceae bacterium]|nr:hypothetical protein [Nitrosomonadaceae bacterium]